MSTRSSYDAVAAEYAAAIGGELAAKPLDRALLTAFAELAPPGPVADLGCGPGHVGAFVRDRGRAVAGVDLSQRMCALAQIPCCAGDVTSLPLRSGSLAGISCAYAVIHVHDRAVAYAEMARVLVPGGVALVSFHVGEDAVHLTEWFGTEVELTFQFLDADAEAAAFIGVGLDVLARLDREPDPEVEHPSRRCYLLRK